MILKNKKMRGYWYIAFAAILWGTLGTFAKLLIERGFTSEEVAFIRLFFGAMTLFIYIVVTDRKILKLDIKGFFITFGIGLVTQAGFNLAYFNAVRITGVSTAAILLYMAPVFLLIWSILIFKEKLNWKKTLGVVLCTGGSFLAVTGGHFESLFLSLTGIGFGLLSALTYSLMSVFGKLAMKTYPKLTIIFYSFTFGALMMFPFINFQHIKLATKGPQFWGLAIGLGIVPSALSYILYFKGISMAIDLSRAGIISILELIVSIIIAVVLFGESLNAIKGMGICFIFSAIVIIQEIQWNKEKRPLMDV